jgi:hypothetical protein
LLRYAVVKVLWLLQSRGAVQHAENLVHNLVYLLFSI